MWSCRRRLAAITGDVSPLKLLGRHGGRCKRRERVRTGHEYAEEYIFATLAETQPLLFSEQDEPAWRSGNA